MLKNVLTRNYFIFLALVLLISLATFWRAFDINLRADDWIVIWIANNPLYQHLTFTVDDLFKLHPILTLHVTIFAKLFGFNHFYWQLSGYIFKVLDSLVVALMMFGITNSKKVAFFSGLIFASFAGGLESFIWEAGRAPAIIIAPLCLGMYFWVISKKDKLFSRSYLLSIFFFLITILGDPGRGIVILALTFIWELLILNQSYSIKALGKIFKKLSFLFLLVFAELVIFRLFVNYILKLPGDFTSAGHVTFLGRMFEFLINNPVRGITNFAYSMGNLLVGWFIKTFESGHLSGPNNPALVGSIIFLLFSVILFKKLIYQKLDKHRISLFFLLWIPITYFPNWILTGFFTGPDGLILGFTHRYLAIPAVGLICFIGFLLAQQKKISGVILLTIVILFNVLTANRILQQEVTYKSAKLANKLWDQIDREVPKGEKNNIFILEGGEPVNYELVGSDAIPFGIRRGITQIDELPIIRVELETVKRLICESGVKHYNALRDMVPNKEPILISHVHAWKFVDGVFTNISDKKRQSLIKEANCKLSL